MFSAVSLHSNYNEEYLKRELKFIIYQKFYNGTIYQWNKPSRLLIY